MIIHKVMNASRFSDNLNFGLQKKMISIDHHRAYLSPFQIIVA
jgi:hypothetical protein